MSTLFRKDSKLSHVITTSVERSKALNDEARATILTILSHKVLSAEGIAKELRKAGYEKATTTIRHHLEILKDCGLIEVVRVEEVRGAVLKYYASTVKFLGFENSFDPVKFNRAVSDTGLKLLKIASSIVGKYGSAMRGISSVACPYCSMQHSREYTILEIMNRGLAEMIQMKDFENMMKQISGKEKLKSG